MEKQQLFKNRLFLALFMLNGAKMTLYLIQIFFIVKYSSYPKVIQNLSSLTLKTKKLYGGGGTGATPAKKPCAYRV